MATAEQCESAIAEAIERINAVDPEKSRHVPDRTLGCTLLDLDRTYTAELEGGRILGFKLDCESQPQVRLLCSSDDLVAMVHGELKFAHAWATGRVHLDASLRDLLRMRAFR